MFIRSDYLSLTFLFFSAEVEIIAVNGAILRELTMNKKPEEELVQQFLKSKLTLAVAESCTGGLLGAVLTSVPGVSNVFKGGAICYANEIKNRILGVSNRILDSDGAVSDACARAMACGVRELFATDVAVAITGIAGPGGGSSEKPVGLVYICVTNAANTISRDFEFSGDRKAIREHSVRCALRMLAETCCL